MTRSTTAEEIFDLREELREKNAQLATLTSILCTEPGQDVVERAKAVVELERGTKE